MDEKEITIKNKDIDRLRTEIAEIKRQNMEIKRQNIEIKSQNIIDKLENFCTMLKSAIIELSLNVPSLVYFERYMKKIEEKDDFIYVISLLHECVIFLYPSSLFLRPVKRLDLSDLFDSSDSATNDKIPSIKEETLRDNYSGLTILHHNAFNHLDSNIQQVYKKYVNGLQKTCQDISNKFGIHISNMFTIEYVLKVDNLNLEIIDRVFDAVAKEGKMKNDNQTKIDFRSLFPESEIAIENQIQWMDVSKNGGPNYSSLYILFETLGVSMNDYNKKVICNVFTTKDGSIAVEQLRSRDYNNSQAGQAFMKLIKSAI